MDEQTDYAHEVISMETRFGNLACPPEHRARGYTAADIEGNVYGGNRNYCAIPGSTYRSVQFNNIWQLSIVYASGATQPVYCLEKGVKGPQGEAYRSRPISQCLSGSTPQQQARVLWILANGYPAITAAQLFACAGVDQASAPALNDNDAYAAVQVAVFSVFNPPADKESSWQFTDCTTGAIHEKSARLQKTVAYLYESAVERAGVRGAAAEARNAQSLSCCVPPTGCESVTVGSATLYNCGPGQLSRACGKVLYGPLMVCAAEMFELSICETQPDGSRCGFITLSDACGGQIYEVASGQEFYLAFPPQAGCTCLQLSLMVNRTEASVAVLCDLDPQIHLQAVGAVPIIRAVKDCECLHICYNPPPCEKEYKHHKPPCDAPKPRKGGMKTMKGYR